MGKTRSQKVEMSLSNKIVENTKDEKISFSFKYFKNLDEKIIRDNVGFLKQMLERIKVISCMTIFEAIILHKMLALEKSQKTEKITKKMIDENFLKKCDNNIYDLFKGHKTLRVFGILDSENSCFYLLMFDPIHDSR